MLFVEHVDKKQDKPLFRKEAHTKTASVFLLLLMKNIFANEALQRGVITAEKIPLPYLDDLNGPLKKTHGKTGSKPVPVPKP